MTLCMHTCKVYLSTVCANNVSCRLQGLADGVVSDIRLHEQPTGLNPVQRTSLYTKKLTWYSRLKPLHSFTASGGATVIRHRLPSYRRKGIHVHKMIYMCTCTRSTCTYTHVHVHVYVVTCSCVLLGCLLSVYITHKTLYFSYIKELIK